MKNFTIIVLALTLASCGDNIPAAADAPSDTADAPSGPVATAKEPVVQLINYTFSANPDNYWSFVEEGNTQFHFPGLEAVWHAAGTSGRFSFDGTQYPQTAQLVMSTTTDGGWGPNCFVNLKPWFVAPSAGAFPLPTLDQGSQTYFGTREGLSSIAQRMVQNSAEPIFRYNYAGGSTGLCSWSNDPTTKWIPQIEFFPATKYDSHSYVFVRGPKPGSTTFSNYFYAEVQ